MNRKKIKNKPTLDSIKNIVEDVCNCDIISKRAKEDIDFVGRLIFVKIATEVGYIRHDIGDFLKKNHSTITYYLIGNKSTMAPVDHFMSIDKRFNMKDKYEYCINYFNGSHDLRTCPTYFKLQFGLLKSNNYDRQGKNY
jgi:hypothetical protein